VRVSAVVVNWQQPELTSAAVASLEAQTGLDEAGLALSVVIVDNGSGDGSAEILRGRHPEHLVLALEANRGFGGGVNAGIRAVQADAVVLLNNDAVADERFVVELCEALRTHPEAGAVTARILLRDPVEGVLRVNSTGNELTRSGNGRDRDWLVPVAEERRPAGEVAGFSGGASALRRSALLERGLFDESLFMYYEDTDLSWRLRRAGWSIRYAPGAVARHAHAASSGVGSDLFRFWNDRNRIVVSVRHAPAAVALRAIVRTSFRAARSVAVALARRDRAARHECRRTLRALGSALSALPSALAERSRLRRSAVVPLARLAETIVPD
jgi:N-acetylglucosaminyl-diphospho-decaprenol L-rhamnosyltransferase